MSYAKFISGRQDVTRARGFEPSRPIAGHLFDFQRDIVKWALARGRAAIFADTGLGKTAMQLEWASHISGEGRVLILCPLAVADQTVKEAARFGVDCAYVRSFDPKHRIQVTNYEMLDRFDPADFTGIVLDESSILKSFTGKTRNAIIQAFEATPYRLACTATPAPNDHAELGNHAEFLGIRSRVEMLAEFFVHDGGSTQSWRLKGHAEDIFWRWVCSWGAVVRLPSDLGYPDDNFALPELRMHEHIVPVNHRDVWSEGFLFAPDARTLSDQRATRRATMHARVEVARTIADASPDPCVIWCELNAEGDAVEASISDAVQIKGSDPLDTKRHRLCAFDPVNKLGKPIRVLVTKPSIAGFGMNWQHCARMVFVGASHSYEQTYQAIRRCWRFGQTRAVDVHVIRAETEGAIVSNYRKKAARHQSLMDGMLDHTRSIQTIAGAAHREWNQYQPAEQMRLPNWL